MLPTALTLNWSLTRTSALNWLELSKAGLTPLGREKDAESEQGAFGTQVFGKVSVYNNLLRVHQFPLNFRLK